MVNVIRHGIILQKRNVQFEMEGVLNPAVILDAGIIRMYYRAVGKGNQSTIGYCTLDGPLSVRHRDDLPVLTSEFDYESQGLEDPRIVKIDNIYYLSYSSFDGKNAFGCVAMSSDGRHFKKWGIVVPRFRGDKLRSLLMPTGLNNKYYQPDKGNHFIWDKNLVFFPRRVRGKLAFLHRIRPGIQIAFCSDLAEITNDYWEMYMSNLSEHIVVDPIFEHEMSYVGAGCPPIETDDGWLIIYHGVCDTIAGYKYSACAALLDLNNPRNEIARLPYPLFGPEENWERQGYVNNVCFPTGSITIDDTLYIYYGAADERIACASVNLPELISELLKYRLN